MKNHNLLKVFVLLIAGLTMAFSVPACGGKKKHHKKHRKSGKYKKYKNKNKSKGIPSKTASEAKSSAEDMGKYLFKAAYVKDFGMVKKIMLTESEAKSFAKPELLKKYASKDKMKEKFEDWRNMFKDGKYKKVKIDNTFEIKPGDTSNPKFKELAAQITKPVKIRTVKVKSKHAKCSFAAIKLGDRNWRLLRLKGCKIK